MNQPKLSVCLAIFNEAAVLDRCLASIKSIADEIVIVDGESTDNSAKIASQYGATIISRPNQANFHKNKRIAFEACRGAWVLQLDADEEVPPSLAKDIRAVVEAKEAPDFLPTLPLSQARLFRRHRQVIEIRDQVDLSHGQIRGYFLARANFFLQKPLRHGGVYPDGVIRLVERAHATLPARHVHEQFQVKGAVSWLAHDLWHHDSPTFEKYWQRAMRYTDAYALKLCETITKLSWTVVARYLLVLPAKDLLSRLIRHKAVLDGWRGIVFAVCSALHHPIAFAKYFSNAYSREPIS